jgi:unsaturated rhamnogalacturonyl hydrolase
MDTGNTVTIAVRAFQKHVATHPLTTYMGILSLQGYARLAVISQNPAVLDDCRDHLSPFVRGERQWRASFTNYFCGGNGTAYLYWMGQFPEAEATVRHYAEDFFAAPCAANGIVCVPNADREKLWIDAAFAVTPFMLFAGLAFGEERYIVAGFEQIDKMYRLFRDPENGLLHQALGVSGPDIMSQDHWSRGNGWGLLALTELVQYLPDRHSCRPAAESMLRDLLAACLRFQDEQGMWHQEITDHTSYVETSGSGLILYALGAGLAKKIIEPQAMAPYLRGLRGYLQYIRSDGTVYHTCRGCNSPGKGTIIDYKQVPPVINDAHAFGPVILAYGQAHSMGIQNIV